MEANRTQLLRWMKHKKIFKTSDIIQWGLDSYSNRASRDARYFAEKPLELIRRLSKFEKECRGLTGKEGYYIVDEKRIEEFLQPRMF